MELAAWARSTIGHDKLALAERLVELDDVYDTLGYSDITSRTLTTKCSQRRGGSQERPDALLALICCDG
jgi:hypothetical protein